MKINIYKTLSLLASCVLVLVLYLPSAHALASVDFAIKEICSHMEGSLGGLLMAAAGVGGIASAAFGNMKAMYSCLVTAIGAYGTSTVLSLYFPDAAEKCGVASSPDKAGARVVSNVSKAEVSNFNPENAAKSYISYYKNGGEVEEKAEAESAPEPKVEEEDSDLDLF